MPGFPVHHQLLELIKLMSITSVMPSNHRILCHPFFSHLQSFPASGSFQMSQFLTSVGQSIGVSSLASVLPMNIQGLISFRIDWFDLLIVQGTPIPQFKNINSSLLSLLNGLTIPSIHYYWKNHSFD